MSEFLFKNKFFIIVLASSIILAASTFANLPGPITSKSVQTINGITFDFSDYGSLNHEDLAIFNYLNTLVSSEHQSYGSWEGWYSAEPFHGLQHYVLAFMDYTVSALFETTPGYRTDYYRKFAYDLIKRMNTTEAEWGSNSIEYKEWTHPDYDFVDYYWPDADNPNDLYVGGFRGPANIMWTGHYTLMQTLYERSFNTGELTNEITWFVEDWQNSVLTDGYGNPKEGGIWGTGIIPCEPYIVFVQCNTIPMFTTALYDNLYGTNFFPMWDYGLNFINTVMQDQYGLFSDGYYVYSPKDGTSVTLPESFPGPSKSPYIRDGRNKVAGYGIAWATAFLEYIQPEVSRNEYPIFLQHFLKEISGDMAYVINSYNNPGGFGTFDILATLYTMQLAKQMGDYKTRDRLLNFMYNSYNKIWSPSGREMHFDTTATDPFLQPALAFGNLWATIPVSIRDLADARIAEFWDYPYLSRADDDRIWVYQAEWDPEKQGFILNVRVDQRASLKFANFDSTPTAYSEGLPFGQFEEVFDGYVLFLNPGTYQLVIM